MHPVRALRPTWIQHAQDILPEKCLSKRMHPHQHKLPQGEKPCVCVIVHKVHVSQEVHPEF